MKRTLFILFLSFACIFYSYAQGSLFDGTEATPGSIRQLARNATTDIDAIIYNPAGTAINKNTFEIAVGYSYSSQNVANYPVVSAEENELIDRSHYSHLYHNSPSVLALVRIKNITLSLSYAHEGGFGIWKDSWGSSPIDAIIHDNNDISEAFKELNEIFNDIKAKEDDFFSVYSQDYLSRYFNRSLRMGCAYKMNDHFSVYAGVKINHFSHMASCDVGIYVKRASENERWPISDYLYSIADRNSYLLLANLLIHQSSFGGVAIDNSQYNNCIWSVSPVFGVNLNYSKLNIGAKFELGYKSKQNSIIYPTNISIGVQYDILRWMRVLSGFGASFNTSYFPNTENGNKKFINATLGFDFMLNETFDISISGLYEKTNDSVSMAGKTSEFPKDSFKISGGLGVRFTENLKANIGLLAEPVVPYVVNNYNINGVFGTCIYRYEPRFVGAVNLVYSL